MTNTAAKPASLPQFFLDHSDELTALVRWTMDKTTEHTPDTFDCEGRPVQVRSWYFEGKMPRRIKESCSKQWDCPKEAAQYTVNLTVRGGEYRGQKQTALVCFSEYRALDGKPLPIK